MMTMNADYVYDQDPQMVVVSEKIQAALAKFGLQDKPTRVVRKLRSGGSEVVSLKWKEKESSIGFDELKASIELYVADAYPDKNGWVFLHAWNCIGNSSRAKDLVAHLQKNGIEARSTTRNKYRGIAVKIGELT